MMNPFDSLTEYELANTAFHLAAARHDEQLHQLLAWPCEGEVWERRNAWFEAKDAVGDIAGYLADVDLGWQAADAALAAPDRRASAVSLQLRYALVVSSLRGRAATLRPELLAAFVREGLWSTAKGLAYASQIPSSTNRAAALAALAAGAADSDSVAALQVAADELAGADERAQVLTALVTAVPAPAPAALIADLLKLVPQLTGDGPAKALAAVAPQLDDEQREGALAAAVASADPSARPSALIVLAAGLNAEQARVGLRAATDIDGPVDRARVVAALAERLSPAERARRLAREDARVSRLKTAGEQARALAALGKGPEALRVAETISDKDARGTTLAQLAPLLTPRQVTRALSSVNDIGSAARRATALASLAPYLPPSSMLTAIRVATSARSPRARADALEALAAHLPQLRLNRVLNEALKLKDVTLRAQVIAVLAPRLSEQQLDSVIRRAARIPRGGGRGALFAAIAPYLSDRQHARAVTLAERMSDPTDRSTALEALATTLSPDALSRAVTALPGLEDTDEIGRTLASLASFVCDKWLDDSLSAVNRMSVLERPTALDALAPRLIEAGREGDLEEAIWQHVEGAPALQGACDLALLAKHLPAQRRAEAFEHAYATVESSANVSSSWALLDVAEHLSSRLRQKALRRALSLARQSGVVYDTFSFEETEQMFWAEQVARQATIARAAIATARAGRPADALPVARSLKLPAWRAEALGSIVPWIGEDQRDAVAREALNAALRASRQASYWIDETNWIGVAGLAGLGGNVQVDIGRRALEVTRTVEERRTRDARLRAKDRDVLRISLVAVRAALAAGLAQRRMNELVNAELDAVRQVGDPKLQARGLAELAPLVSEEVLDDALAIAAAIGDARSRSDATVALVDRVAGLRGAASSLPVALAIPEREPRRQALAAVAAHARDLADPELLRFWQFGADGEGIARNLSARTRADLLSGIEALRDVIVRLAPAPADELAAAIDDAVAWWPP